MRHNILVGIDEAGRGPLAGPVAVGVFVVSDPSILKIFKGVKDSKQLSEKQREEWFEKIKDEISKIKNRKQGGLDWEIDYTVSFSSSKVIDRVGITKAVQIAMNRALNTLKKRGSIAYSSKILLDGLLHAPEQYKDQKTIIHGDAIEPVISLASICAKVLRDRKMKRLIKKYPQYGFEIHKGYGTKSHYKAIKKYGVSDIHRRSYLKGL
jgi:ribonuclease HII